MAEQLYVTFGDPSCISFWDIVRKSRQTDTQTDTGENSTLATALGVGNPFAGSRPNGIVSWG